MTVLEKTIANDVERIYLTKGHESLNEVNHKNDKRCGVVIDGLIHWLAQPFAYNKELKIPLQRIGIDFTRNGRWSVLGDDSSEALKSTPINYEHEDIFFPSSGYMQRTKVNPATNDIYWTPQQIINEYQNNN